MSVAPTGHTFKFKYLSLQKNIKLTIVVAGKMISKDFRYIFSNPYTQTPHPPPLSELYVQVCKNCNKTKELPLS